MRSVRYLVQRNTALFLNNKLNILLSLASIPIVISLYVFFLRDFLMVIVGQSGVHVSYVSEFTDRLMFAGLLVVINTTTCFGIIQICVNDSATGIKKDFLSAPIPPFSILAGYWVTSTFVSFFFTVGTAIAGEVFFGHHDRAMMPAGTQMHVLFILLFSSCMNSGILLCFARGIKNTTTFSTFANLYGTVIGFLAGAYLPYYFYPSWLKSILLWFPPTQITSILRREYIGMFQGLTGESRGITKMIYQNFGVELQVKNHVLAVSQQWSVLVITMAILLLCLWSHKRS